MVLQPQGGEEVEAGGVKEEGGGGEEEEATEDGEDGAGDEDLEEYLEDPKLGEKHNLIQSKLIVLSHTS